MSLLCFTDGETVVTCLLLQDHKRVGDNDVGPNTGGMGAYAPAPCLLLVCVVKLLRKY